MLDSEGPLPVERYWTGASEFHRQTRWIGKISDGIVIDRKMSW